MVTFYSLPELLITFLFLKKNLQLWKCFFSSISLHFFKKNFSLKKNRLDKTVLDFLLLPLEKKCSLNHAFHEKLYQPFICIPLMLHLLTLKVHKLLNYFSLIHFSGQYRQSIKHYRQILNLLKNHKFHQHVYQYSLAYPLVRNFYSYQTYLVSYVSVTNQISVCSYYY